MKRAGKVYGDSQDLKLPGMTAYEGQILCMDTLRTKLSTAVFVAMGKLPWQQRGISISQLSEGVEGPHLVQR